MMILSSNPIALFVLITKTIFIRSISQNKLQQYYWSVISLRQFLVAEWEQSGEFSGSASASATARNDFESTY